jgi:hypothetical protein
MARLSVSLTLLLILMAIPDALFAKDTTSEITISGSDLKVPIEITDPVIKNFRIWSGPNPAMPASSSEPQSLIMNWSRGAVSEPQNRIPRYKVCFYVRERAENEKKDHEQLVQVLFYALDPSSGQGYVYLPAATDQGNVSAMIHGVEGNWFHAWDQWQRVADPLIAKATAISSAPARKRSSR